MSHIGGRAGRTGAAAIPVATGGAAKAGPATTAKREIGSEIQRMTETDRSYRCDQSRRDRSVQEGSVLQI